MDALQDEIRSNSTLRDLEQLRGIIIDCAKNIKSNDTTFEISTLPTVSEKLTNYMEQYIESKRKIESYQKAFLNLNQDIDQLDEGEDIETFEEYVELDKYSKKFDDVSNNIYSDLNRHEIDTIKIIRSELEKIIRPQEEEIQFEQAPIRQIPKDPMTKKPIKVAVRSTICNHVYDKDGIEEYFKLREQANKGNRIQCPQAGCTNKTMSRSELVSDEETNRLIQSLS